MIIGIVLGILIGILPAFFGGIAISDNVKYGHEWIGIIFGVFIEIILIIIGAFIGIQVDRVEYNKKIANWNNTKNTLELSIKDENISDIAKIDLVNKAIKYNMQLTELKEDVKQWWYFYLDDSKVKNLKLINITGNIFDEE